MRDATLRELERRSRAGDDAAAARLGLEACRRGEHLPPAHGDDHPADSLRVQTSGGPADHVTWTCPRCWEFISDINPAWRTEAFYAEREAWRDAKARECSKHIDGCTECRVYDARPFCVHPPDALPPLCWPPQWRFDGAAVVAERARAGVAP